MKYKIITGAEYNIEKTVNDHIQAGWKPLGGPFYNDRRNSIGQAMTFEGIKPDEGWQSNEWTGADEL